MGGAVSPPLLGAQLWLGGALLTTFIMGSARGGGEILPRLAGVRLGVDGGLLPRLAWLQLGVGREL